MFSHVSNGSYKIERMEVVDNNSDHDEVLDAAITYKIDGIYPSNSSKDRKEQFEGLPFSKDSCSN